jgi:hypothetical protein
MATRRKPGKRSKRRSRRPARPRPPRREPAAPLTLAECRAVVRLQQAATQPLQRDKQAALREIGRDRKQLDRKRRRQLVARRRAYDDAYGRLARRGIEAPVAAAPAPATGPLRAQAAPSWAAAPSAQRTPQLAFAVAPLRILAEGDSWFDYPVLGSGGGIIPRLATRIGLPIHNLAQAGDEVRFMLGVKQRLELAAELQRMVNHGTPNDALLFSGGGNDIVGDPLCLWIEDFDPNLPPAQHVQAARFQAALDLVRAGYEDLVSIRNAISGTTRLFLHAYDFAIPDGSGVCFLGPWLKPSFDLRHFPSLAARSPVVVEMLTRFRDELVQLVANHAGVILVPTQGTLSGAGDWGNELHPDGGGFDKIVEVFRSALAAEFPGRIPT